MIRVRTEEEIRAEWERFGINQATSPVPVVSGVSPNTGSTLGQTNVTILGNNFTGTTAVRFGGQAATNVVVRSATNIAATTPAHAAGPVSVTVTTRTGTSANNAAFTYQTPPAPPPPLPNGRVGPTICLQNKSTVLTDQQIQTAMAALQIQLDRDWQAAWGTTATLVFANANQSLPAGSWPIYIMDTSDVKGALGYHDELPSGTPYGKIFAKDDMTYGYNWTVTLSHELLEMMLDPYINLSVFNQTSNTAGTIYAYEACDACEADNLGYQINGIQVSDFVWPAWFDTTISNYAGKRFDQQQHLTAPFQLYSGGYIGVFPVPNNGTGWSSINAEHVIGPPDSDDMVSSRSRDRRSRT